MKRKIFNKVFDFNFIKSLAPQIAKICDRMFEKIEGDMEGKEFEYNIHNFTE